jgi:hypothetical protein
VIKRNDRSKNIAYYQGILAILKKGKVGEALRLYVGGCFTHLAETSRPKHLQA